MDYQKLFETILDLCAAMISCGGETRRVEITLAMLTKAYGYTSCHLFVIPANVQATVTAPDGDVYTQMREVRNSNADYGLLDKLNALSREAYRDKPSDGILRKKLDDIINGNKKSTWLTYLAGAIGVAGFAGFFGCDVMDILVAVAVSLFVTFALKHLTERESNPLIKNFVISLCAEFLILLLVHLGIGHHSGYITIGVVMMLVSGLTTANGIHDLVHLDTFSGLSNIFLSITGAVGIALGIAVPLFLLKNWDSGELMSSNSSFVLMLIFAALASSGFAVWYGVRGRKIITCALGGVITTAAYLLLSGIIDNLFVTNLLAAAVTGVYAQIMVRVEKAPATIFDTFGVFPLIPGSSLYFMMYGILTGDKKLASSQGLSLFYITFGIVLGLMAVEAVMKYIAKGRKS